MRGVSGGAEAEEAGPAASADGDIAGGGCGGDEFRMPLSPRLTPNFLLFSSLDLSWV